MDGKDTIDVKVTRGRPYGSRPQWHQNTSDVRLTARNKTSITLPGDIFDDHQTFLSALSTLKSFEAPYEKLDVSDIARQHCTLIISTQNSVTSAQLHAKLLWYCNVPAIHASANLLPSALSIWDSCSAIRASSAKPGPGECFADTSHNNDESSWSPQAFYENAHVPDQTRTPGMEVQPSELESKLYPFQRRTVEWLLQREGALRVANSIDDNTSRSADLLPLYYSEQTDLESRPFLVSNLIGEVVKQEDRASLASIELKGGILAEEMGLGKTVELIALMCLHKRPASATNTIHDSFTNSDVRVSNATLIITPPSILEQWKSELHKHAPGLKIFQYEGLNKSKISSGELLEVMLKQDIVITTYRTIASEIYFAAERPERNMRHARVTEPLTSPLVKISWWRVCLDEAQMVESGVSNAAKVAQRIPRVNAWAVTGTPVRKDVEDLFGLLLFLRFQPFCQPSVWARLLRSFKPIFASIFKHIALRHTKATIPELQLPPQRRIVITVPFSAIEDQYYSQLFTQMCEDCGLDREGGPVSDDWNPEDPGTVENMRRWLTRLRQACLHPEIGDYHRRAAGFGRKLGPMRTVDEVLEVMMQQNESNTRIEERAMLQAMIMRGHLLSFGRQARASLTVYLDTLGKSNTLVDECREELVKAESRSKADHDSRLSDWRENGQKNGEEAPTKVDYAVEQRLRLRSALEVQHTCLFFVGTAYFQIKSDPELTKEDSQEFHKLERLESEFYDHAKVIRKELLRPAAQSTYESMENVRRLKPADIPVLNFMANPRGIESRMIKDKYNELAQTMNAQLEQLLEWRGQLIKLLLAKLVDQDEDIETTGEEYEASTKDQDKQYVYLFALRIAVADRTTLVNGQSNLLINHEMKEALKMAHEGEGHDPELTKAVIQRVMELRPQSDYPGQVTLSMRGLLAEVRSLVPDVRGQDNSRNNRGRVEATLLEEELEKLQEASKLQTKALTALEREVDQLRSTMNSRLAFYRQLQQLSDAVAPLQQEVAETVNQTLITAQKVKEQRHAAKITALQTTRRFLTHLRADPAAREEQRTCVICREGIEIGVLTVCGHQYCKECIKLWWAQHKTCPVCKRRLKLSEFHDITYKPTELTAREERAKTTESSPNSDIYSTINQTTLDEIKSIDLGNSFGTKIDTMARHLLWIRAHDPGAKSIIFSQYGEFLQVLARALAILKIGFAEMRNKNGITRFMEDPSVECFLLHAKADSSGLNLVNATHVFLCEPLINTAIELQAIARVHRIGQQRPTTVWMYLVSDTVEEAIYDISVSRRLKHMRRAGPPSAKSKRKRSDRAFTPRPFEESQLEAANSIELQSAPLSNLLTKGASGGEIVQKSDLWNCLFGKARKKEQTSASRELERAAGIG